MPVLALDPITGREGGFTFVIFPYFVIGWFPRLTAQGAFLENGPLVISVEFKETRFLALIPTVGQND
jgi:hypothetical protein